MDFKFKIKDKKKYVVVQLSGNLIEKNQATEMLDEISALLAHDVNYFVLDMEDLKYMNSSGINVLLNVLTKSRKAGGDLVILKISEKLISVFSFLKLHEVFTVVEHEEDVLPLIV